MGIGLDPVEPWLERLKDTGLDFKNKEGWLKINLTPKDFEQNKDLLRELLRQSVLEDERE